MLAVGATIRVHLRFAVFHQRRFDVSMPSTHPLLIRSLGRQTYSPVWDAMRVFTDTRDSQTIDELWVLEHDPVFTLGQAGKWEHVLAPGDIPVIPVDRGGQVTFHGPGQLVVYPLFDLRRLHVGVRDLVHGIEQSIIDALLQWQIHGQRRQGAPGVYVNHEKIAALGLRIRRGCSFHGLAFNVHMDLEPFHRINPCGYRGLGITQLSALGGPTDLGVVADVLVASLCHQFSLQIMDSASTLPEPATESNAA